MQQERTNICKECLNSFKAKRPWQLFCSIRCKNYFHAQRYDTTCVYCGLEGKHKKFIPASVFSDKPYFTKAGDLKICEECYRLLKNRLTMNTLENIDYLIETYASRYHLGNGVIAWDIEEIDDLGPTLRSHVKRSLSQRHANEIRYIYLKAVRTHVIEEKELI